MSTERPRVDDLWRQAGGGTPAYDRGRFLDLMREHGHLLRPGDEGYDEAPDSLPCGWSGNDLDEANEVNETETIP